MLDSRTLYAVLMYVNLAFCAVACEVTIRPSALRVRQRTIITLRNNFVVSHQELVTSQKTCQERKQLYLHTE